MERRENSRASTRVSDARLDRVPGSRGGWCHRVRGSWAECGSRAGGLSWDWSFAAAPTCPESGASLVCPMNSSVLHGALCPTWVPSSLDRDLYPWNQTLPLTVTRPLCVRLAWLSRLLSLQRGHSRTPGCWPRGSVLLLGRGAGRGSVSDTFCRPRISH